MEAHLRGIKKVIAKLYLTILTLFLRIEGKEKFREKRLVLRDINAIVRYKLRMLTFFSQNLCPTTLTFFLRILNVHLTIQFFVSVIKKRQLLCLFSSIATFYLTILTFFLLQLRIFISQFRLFFSELRVYLTIASLYLTVSNYKLAIVN